MWFVVRRVKTPDRTRRLLRTTLVVLLAGSLLVSLIAARADDFDFVYYSLPTRAAELIIGALLATSLVVTRRVGTRAGLGTTALGFGALGAIIAHLRRHGTDLAVDRGRRTRRVLVALRGDRVRRVDTGTVRRDVVGGGPCASSVASRTACTSSTGR